MKVLRVRVRVSQKLSSAFCGVGFSGFEEFWVVEAICWVSGDHVHECS